MTATADRVLKEIRALPAPDLRLVWQEVNAMMFQLEPPPMLAPAGTASREEIMAALDRLTGCTAGSRSLPRLLDERHRGRERETSELVLASAQRSGAILVHKDPEMVQLGGLIRQEVLPLKSGSPATQ